jgi:hypothetical protein
LNSSKQPKSGEQISQKNAPCIDLTFSSLDFLFKKVSKKLALVKSNNISLHPQKATRSLRK